MLFEEIRRQLGHQKENIKVRAGIFFCPNPLLPVILVSSKVFPSLPEMPSLKEDEHSRHSSASWGYL